MDNRYSALRTVELRSPNFRFGRSFYRMQKIGELPVSGPLNAPGEALQFSFRNVRLFLDHA